MRKRCHAPKGKPTIFNTPLPYYSEKRDNSDSSGVKGRQTERKRDREERLMLGKRESWLVETI